MALKQLQLLAKVQLEKEEKLQAQFIQAQQFAQLAAEKYAGLANYRTDYIRQSQQRGAEGIASRQFNQYLNFITKLDQALTQQNMQVQQAQRVAGMRRTAWLEMQKKRKALDLLIDKELQAGYVRAQKQEQKMLDEMATQQFFRRLQTTEQ
ncbi:MAG: flagellar export protein FliJ [Gammaproteobacteria bacterium]|jgi:flagellar protein FliJ|nr:flagellar export protein FliJ [Gammaproteobacteria bacterium]MBU2278311.1 flagellar export protein FliJ [Gammaproteobacteria bacterium]MBU2428386.1 flagellar export protein FliJ [Gammaproteobacteria bacterium]